MAQMKKTTHGTIQEDWRPDGYVYLTRAWESRKIASGAAVTLLNVRRNDGLTEAELLWIHAR